MMKKKKKKKKNMIKTYNVELNYAEYVELGILYV